MEGVDQLVIEAEVAVSTSIHIITAITRWPTDARRNQGTVPQDAMPVGGEGVSVQSEVGG